MATDNGGAQPEQTQAQTGETVSPVVETQTQGDPGQHAGFQKRIDELTAKRYEVERQAQAREADYERRLAEQNAQMTALLLGAQRQTPAAPDPLDEVAPEDRRRVEAILSPKLKELEFRLAEVDRTLAQQRQSAYQQEFQARASQERPEVVERANALFTDWTKRGLQGFRMVDALIYARGELGVPAPAAAPAPRAPNGQFTTNAQHVQTSQSAPPPPVPRPAQGLPANLSSLSYEKQAEILEKHLEGVFL